MDENIIEEIKSRIDIVDLISDYVELKRAGQNYKGLCPFHAERTPSFIVSPDKQIYHCFGCGEGGNIFSFIMRHDNVTFPEALRFLAKRAGLSLKESKSIEPGGGLKHKLIELNRESMSIFQENLKNSKEALSYLEGRGIGISAIKTFCLGYSVRSWNYLYNHLKNKGFTESLMLQAGLIGQGEKGFYDIFRDRIIFPIRNLQGEVIAFGGRVMDDSLPKYINSPDTVIFKKGENLYGLDMAKDEIRKRGFVIITEGYLDVITSHEKGFPNTVAPLGTALTEAHLSRLRRLTKKVILVFDGDEAGRSAARRSIPILLSQGFKTGILLLPQGEDLDSFLRKNAPDLFRDALSKAKSPLSFLFESSSLDKTETTREVIKLIAPVRDVLLREELIKELSELSGFREMALRVELKRLTNKKGYEKDALTFKDKAYDEEVLLLSSVISFPEKIRDVIERLPLKDLRNTIVKGIFEKLGISGSIEEAMPSMNAEERSLISRLTIEPGFDTSNVDKNIEDCLNSIRGRIVENTLREIHDKIRKAEKTGQEEILKALLIEKQKVLREMMQHKSCFTVRDVNHNG